MTQADKISEIYNYLMGEGLFKGNGVKDILTLHSELIKKNTDSINDNSKKINNQKTLYYKIAGLGAGVGSVFGFFVKYFLDFI